MAFVFFVQFEKHTKNIFYIFLYLLGLFLWGQFLNWGNISFTHLDWGKDYNYLILLQESLSKSELPFHSSLFFQGTDRFLGLPEIILSPQILLLNIMDVGVFFLLNMFFLYSIGFYGTLAFSQKYNLHLVTFFIIFILFNFNGYIASHIGAGHSMWGAYFFMPLFFYFIFGLMEKPNDNSLVVKISLTMFFQLLQGGFHFYVWIIYVLILLGITRREYLESTLKIIVLSVFLSAFRLFPATLALSHWSKNQPFVASYETVLDLIGALIISRPVTHVPNLYFSKFFIPGWWEYDVYVGIIGLSFLIYFGIFCTLKEKNSCFNKLLPASLIMVLLSIGGFYAGLYSFKLPVLESQRVATRFIIVPFLIFVFLGAIHFEKHFQNMVQISRYISIILVAQMAFEVCRHFFQWGVLRVESYKEFLNLDFRMNPNIIYREDFIYKETFYASSLLSVLTVTVLFILLLRKKLNSLSFNN